MRICQTEGCAREAFCRGLCRSCYERIYTRATHLAWQRKKYAEDPAYREKKLAQCKARNLTGLRPSTDAQWRRNNRDVARLISRRHDAKYREEHGVGRSAVFVPGKACRVFANGAEQIASLASKAYRIKGVWSVDVLLPWGETVTFKTSEVKA